ncbi:MAG: alpha/beta hydrolase-fold protein [Bacteroidota bacterium]
MKKFLRITLIALVVIAGIVYAYRSYVSYQEVKAHQAWVATLEHTASPNVQIWPDTILVDYLDEKRTLALYLPEGYETDSIDYPVIYFLDGQSLYDQKIQEGTEWEVDEVLDSIANLGGQKAIVVGVYNTEDRLKEYKPFPSDRWYSDKRGTTGDLHAEWIVSSLKPWIDQQFRTLPAAEHTVIAGASLGGLMSYYMLMTYPETFGNAIVFSPSFWVSEDVYSLHKGNRAFAKQKIYFNAGELETSTVSSIEKMHAILLEQGMPAENMKLDVEAELGHWHLTWLNGFKKAYPWILTGEG